MNESSMANHPRATPLATSSASSGQLLKAKTAALFLKMTATYGQKWQGYAPGKELLAVLLSEWGEALSDLTDDQIAQGARAMKDAHPEWPPTIGQFRALCRPQQSDEPEHRRRPVYVRQPPDPPEVWEERRRMMAAMKEDLYSRGVLPRPEARHEG